MVCKHQWVKYDEPIKDDQFCRCTTCGVIKTTKKHWINRIKASAYGQDYFHRPELWTIINGIPMNAHYLDIHLPYLSRFNIPQQGKGKRLLYLGCGIGQLIPYFLAGGWQIDCMDISEWAVTYIQSAYPGVNATCADFEKVTPASKYDLILALHVLEHFPTADFAFDQMTDLLAPAGILYIEIPYGPKDIYIHDHFWHFSEEAIINWFIHTGLEQFDLARTLGKDGRELVCFHCKGVKPC